MDTKKTLMKGGCVSNSQNDEPIFALVARDRLAPRIVRRWAREAAEHGASALKVGEAMLTAAAMVKWEKRNGSKNPD